MASGSAAVAPAAAAPVTAEPASAAPATVPADPPALVLVHERRPTIRPVTADIYSLKVTVDAAFKRELEELTQLLSHKVPNGDLATVLRQAVQCALEKHGKRRGAMEPTRKRKVTPSPSAAKSTAIPGRQPISAEVRRQVWKRDEGCCAWTGPDGRRCGSKWKLELDHIHAAALGGPSTVENLRLTCAAHNKLHAEKTYGAAHMARFRRDTPQSGELAAPRGSGVGGAGSEVGTC